MKKIQNWKLATVADIEADGLLENATLFHVLSFHMANGKKGNIDGSDHQRLKNFLSYHIDNKIPVVFHRGIFFDIPLCEKLLGMDLSKLMVIDTLALSWYLNTKRKIHGLDSFLEDYGVPKPKVGEAEWVTPIRGIKLEIRTEGKGKERVKILTYKYLNEPEGLSEEYHKVGINIEEEDLNAIGEMEDLESFNLRKSEHKKLMFFRCEEDVKINLLLWQDFMKRLHEMYIITKSCIDSGQVNPKRSSPDEVTYLDRYVNNSTVDEYIERCLTFLMFKMDCARLQEKTRWKVDTGYLKESLELLEDLHTKAKEKLEGIMPPVPKYSPRKKPKGDPRKKDGTLKVSVIKWNETLDQIGMKDHYGNEMVLLTDKEDEVKLLTKYEEPNANSSNQLKKFFFSKGWIPENFKYVKDEEAMEAWVKGGFRKEDKPEPRKVPQISIDGDEGKELCQSILKIAENYPEIMAYDSYTTVKHRLDVIKGFIRDMREDHLQARIGGFTNCLTADTVVVTSRGSLFIGEVKEGDKVLTHKGTYSEVIDTIDNGVKDVYRVRMEDGREIRCTYNHKFWNGSSWVMAIDLKEGDTTMVYGNVEDWREIRQTLGYKISSWGRIMNPDGTIKKINHLGGRATYSTELEWVDGVRRNSIIGRLVMESFVGKSDLHVLHKDGNPYNNNIQNLKYGTDSDNMVDTKLHGKHVKSVRNKINNKLSHSNVIEIKKLSGCGISGKELASMFGVSPSMISMVLHNKRWSEDLNEENLYVEEFIEGVVESVRLVSTEPTFDISVKDVHSYVANGFVVHNTLRVQHRELANLIGVDKPYGENIRGVLTCEEDEILLGSDLSSLEDRTKHHFMLPHDPDYVETMMADDYDPHILTAHSAGLVTDQELADFKKGIKPEHVSKARKGGKSTNYACVYGGSPQAIALSAGVDLSIAKKLHEGYWKLNWSVKTIAEEQCVFEDSRKQKWLINPINGIAYSLRTEKDRFSTLAQGTGSFFFDMWVDRILDQMEKTFKTKKLTGSFHK